MIRVGERTLVLEKSAGNRITLLEIVRKGEGKEGRIRVSANLFIALMVATHYTLFCGHTK